MAAKTNNSKIDKLKLKFFSILENLNISEKKFKIAVAVSGGADSLALILLINDWVRSKNSEIYAVTIDHGLRAESKKEALMTKQWLKDRGINHKTIKLDVNKEKNISKEARDERYKKLIDFCQKKEIYDLFLGHNLDDQAENFLIRSIRGSGVEGLAAIKQIIYMDNVRIIRPLLVFSRSEIEVMLSSFSQTWIEDPTNKNEIFLRAKIRNFFVNQSFLEIDLLKKRFAENSLKLLSAEEILFNRIFDFIYQSVKIDASNIFLVNKKEFLFLGKYLSVKFLKKIITILGKKEYGPRIRGIEKIYDFLLKDTSKGEVLINSCLVKAENRSFFSISAEKIFN